MRYQAPIYTGPLVMLAVLCLTTPATGEELDARDAVRLALDNNPNLRAAALDVRAANEAVSSAESDYLPSLRVNLGGGRDESFSGTLEGVAPNANDQVGLDVGVSYQASWGTDISLWFGGGWSARETNRDPGTTDNVNVGSTYSLDGRLEVRQPLLRGAGRDVGEANLRTARLSRTAAEHARDQEASELLRDVLSAYWDLWVADATVEVNEAALEMAERQLEEATLRATELGTMAPAEVLRFTSELASIQEELQQAESSRVETAIGLGRLLDLTPTDAIALDVTSESPPEAELRTLEEVMELARVQSSELHEANAQLAIAQDRVEVAEDATLPRLDLTGSLALGGLWNDETIDSFDLPGDRPAISGMVGLELELPLGNSRARAGLAEARIRAEAAEVRIEGRTRQIEAAAASAVSRLEAASRSVELTARTVEISRQLAEAERERLRLGTTTPFQVLEAQESLRTTELRHLRALVSRTTAAIELQHLTGELIAEYAALTVAY